jgi:hypothetical protein
MMPGPFKSALQELRGVKAHRMVDPSWRQIVFYFSAAPLAKMGEPRINIFDRNELKRRRNK